MDRTHSIGEVLLSIGGSASDQTPGGGLNVWRGEGGNRRLILRDVVGEIRNITRPSVEQGQVVGLLGPSGIGKTTLFGAIAGFTPPDSGQVLVGQQQISVRSGMVGVVSQDYTVLRHKTVLDNLTFAGRQAGLSAAEAKEKALAYLNEFDLYDRRNNWPYGQISGGQRQRLAILQQVMAGHQFICMDEPFSGLDVNQVQNVARLICQVTSLDTLLTIIVVTHDIGAAIETSDTVWLMGKERDPENADLWLEGARITRSYDLIKLGLAWDPDIRHQRSFAELQSDIVEQFRLLSHC